MRLPPEEQDPGFDIPAAVRGSAGRGRRSRSRSSNRQADSSSDMSEPVRCFAAWCSARSLRRLNVLTFHY